MSAREDVVRWARQIVQRKGAPPHELLGVPAGAGADVAQRAFHAIARIAHPDLHRRALPPDELELVTTAYARVAGAYHDLRHQRPQPGRAAPVTAPPAGATARPAITPGSAHPSAGARPGAAGPASAMNSKALLYFRKAELALKRGDLAGARLQLKLAIAGDPQSAFLRSALAELDAELARQS